MNILIASPLRITQVGGPATVARELLEAYREQGDEVRIITPTDAELMLPIGLRQLALFIRALPQVRWADAVLMLDPVTTGPAIAPLARLFRKRSVLRIGGDILWESHVNRVREPILLSEFYSTPRKLSLKERLIRAATRFTLSQTDHVAFSTSWLTGIWKKPYALTNKSVSIVENGLPERTERLPQDPTKKIFLAASRGPYLKNYDTLAGIWPMITNKHPEAELDATSRPPALYKKALRSAYALILPSISDISPNAVLEAIAAGIPFVTTKDTGLYETYKDAGIFVDTRDPEAIRAAVEQLLDPAAYAAAVARFEPHTRTRSWNMAAAEFRSLFRVS